MQSNFEDLLKELEEDFVSPAKPASNRTTNNQRSEIDDLFEELKEIEKVEPVHYPASQIIEERKKTFQKCYPIILSGGNKTGCCVT